MMNVGMPVSWQMGPESSTAMSMLDKIMLKAWEDCVSGVSSLAAMFMAARTSGGRFVDVWVINSSKLPARNSIALPPRTFHFTLLRGGVLERSPVLIAARVGQTQVARWSLERNGGFEKPSEDLI